MLVRRDRSFLANPDTLVMIGQGVWTNQMGDIVSLDFNTAFYAFSNKKLIWKLGKYKADGRTVKWVESPQVCQAEVW